MDGVPINLVQVMNFAQWSIEELEALANVYLKHKQIHKAQPLRRELQRRLTLVNRESLRVLVDRLDRKNMLSLTERILGRLKKLA
jgi:hypothetical protein